MEVEEQQIGSTRAGGLGHDFVDQTQGPRVRWKSGDARHGPTGGQGFWARLELAGISRITQTDLK